MNMLEVCVDTIQAAKLAEIAGADRIELCSALDLGGVTPSGAFIRAVRQSTKLPLIVLIRCRAGDFEFDDMECELMCEEATQAIELGANGIAIGGLTATQELHIPFLKSIAERRSDCQLVIHRAFDSVRNPESALEQLIDMGFTRILTSGGPDKAIDGLAELRKLVDQAKGRIEILPAGGISDANAEKIIELTGVTQLHGSFRKSAELGSERKIPDSVSIAKAKAVLNRLTHV